MKIHELKTWPQYFDLIKFGMKTFEFRKNDRNFKAGDILHLRKFDPKIQKYLLEEELLVKVQFIVNDEEIGMPKDYVIMEIKVLK
jgi:ASC-1-like (ASCH) protein